MAADVSQAKTRNRVTVGCKMSNGFTARVYDFTTNEHGQKVSMPISDPVTFAGANKASVKGGFGFTDVDADFWDAWLKQAKNHPAIKNGLIFAHDRRQDTIAHALDHKEAKTGLEPIDPTKPQMMGIPGIEAVPEKELKEAIALGAP